LFSIYCFFDIFSLSKKNNEYKNLFKENKIAFNTQLVKHKPNVYFMLFDEYPGYKSLKDSFSFKNDSLYQFFKNNNFKILPSFSNYNYTLFSMSSILNMNYIDYKPFGKYVPVDEFKQRSREITNTKFFSIFESMDYDVKNYSIFDIKNNQGIGYSFSLNIGNDDLITDKMLHSRFIKNVGWIFVTGKFSIPVFKNCFQGHAANDYNKKVEQALETALINKNKNKNPQFLYLHFLLPHAPYYYNENGVLEDNAAIFNAVSPRMEKNKFIGYLKYTNLKMQAYINQIIKHDSAAIIICMSDHGFKEYNRQEDEIIPEVFDNICAVRFPDLNYLPLQKTFSNVNFFRYLFNSQFNQHFSYLKDSSFFLNRDIRKK
jgi:hypothetical protein